MPRGFCSLGKSFPKGSTRTRCGLQVVWKRHSQVTASRPGQERAGCAHGSLSTSCLGIQVKQESVQDQEKGAWKIPSVFSVLVSPSGVFSVYLFFSREHGGALTVTKEQKDWHRANPAPCRRNMAFVCSLLQKTSNCPAWTSAVGKAGTWPSFSLQEVTF